MNSRIILPNKISLWVIQQPKNKDSFVSPIRGCVTQFRRPRLYGCIGLLAHNYSSGMLFSDLKIGEKVEYIKENGIIESYTINRIEKYQALAPKDIKSQFINLETNDKLSYNQLFNKMFTKKNTMVFMTCIQKGNQDSWGRLFVIAEKSEE